MEGFAVSPEVHLWSEEHECISKGLPNKDQWVLPESKLGPRTKSWNQQSRASQQSHVGPALCEVSGYEKLERWEKPKHFLRQRIIIQHMKVDNITADVEEWKPLYRCCYRANSFLGLCTFTCLKKRIKRLKRIKRFYRPLISGFNLNLVLLQFSLLCLLKPSIKESLVQDLLVLKNRVGTKSRVCSVCAAKDQWGHACRDCSVSSFVP